MTRTEPILPDFLIIGAMKAGTTTLHEYLARHPEVGMSREKETDFFLEQNFGRGAGWYSGQFTPGRRIYGEASPNYTKKEAFPGVPARAAAVVPGVRLIFIARDPVDRAASHYRHAQLAGLPVPGPAGLEGSRHLRHLIETSSYAAQIDAWAEHFQPERFLFLSFEELARDPRAVLSQLARFLGIADDWAAAKDVAANSGDSLARLPPWLFRLRQSAAGRWLKQYLSGVAVRRLKGMVGRGPARAASALPPEIRARIAEATRADAARYAALAARSVAVAEADG